MKSGFVCFLSLLSLSISAQEVSVKTLLPQMTDLSQLTQRPKPFYETAQSSSYDRKSIKPGNPDWFANGDNGRFVRQEKVGDRVEWVMADLKGPGSVVRLWSANPMSVVRFYFDGETTPRIEKKLVDLLGGKVAPFGDPFGYYAAHGYDLYFPFPYQKSLKITIDETEKVQWALYYHVGYRTYSPGTKVKTFTMGDAVAAKSQMAKQAKALMSGSPLRAMPTRRQARLQPGGTMKVGLNYAGGGQIARLQVKIPFPIVQTFREMDWTDPHQPHNVLENLLLSIKFDGEKTVSAPLGDFFGSVPGLVPYRTLPFHVDKDGTMTCDFPMPFKRTAEVSIENVGKVEVPVTVVASGAARDWTRNSYTFHAQWTGEHARTRPMRDMNFLTAKGEGIFVGDNMHISNPSTGWWGEGDEKIYVDGESFPSTFGTGSEDYYGYAWSSNEIFQRPYHAQPHSEKLGNLGHSEVMRYHIFDNMPFQKSFKFDMEMWHWADVVATYVHTAYWYAKPGTTLPARIDHRLLPIPYIPGPEPVKGAIEGEKMKVISRTGGKLEVQEGFADLSDGKQLWWQDVNLGDKLVVQFNVPAAGTYEVVGNFCHANDYGIHKMTLNGQAITPIDFYGNLGWKKSTLGTFRLPKGNVTLEVECVGKNPKANPAGMFGLDYLLLNKKG